LGGARNEVSWVNILRDPEAAKYVVARRGGNEEVPTVVTGAGDLIEPTPEAIKARLSAEN